MVQLFFGDDIASGLGGGGLLLYDMRIVRGVCLVVRHAVNMVEYPDGSGGPTTHLGMPWDVLSVAGIPFVGVWTRSIPEILQDSLKCLDVLGHHWRGCGDC